MVCAMHHPKLTETDHRLLQLGKKMRSETAKQKEKVFLIEALEAMKTFLYIILTT